MKTRQEIAVGKCSDRGVVRELNEDTLLYWEPDDANEIDREGRIALVADGMGGAAAGEIASHLATQLIVAEYRRLDHTRTNGERFVNAFRAANRELYLKTLMDSRLAGMGTTCSGLLVHGGQAFLAHAGDSRVYLVRDRHITQLTTDHVVAPGSNIITRSMGTEPSIEIDAIGPIDLEPGDRYLLCTDGLWSLVREDEMAELAGMKDPDEACRQLVDLAKSRGAHDNVTVLLVRVDATPKLRPARHRSGEHSERALAIVLIVITLLGGIAFGFLAGRQYQQWQQAGK